VTTEAEYPADADPVNPFPVDWLGDDETVPELQRLHRLKAQAEARESAVIARAHRRGVPQAQGFASLTAWLIAATGEPPPVCRSRIRVALALEHMGHTRQAFAAGELSSCRVRLLVDARANAPDLFRRDESLLVGQARTLSARVFPRALSHWRRLADPDGARFDAEAAFLARHLHISPTWERTVRVDGDLDPESGQIILTAVRSLAEPAALEPGDRRTPAQRRADALTEICRRYLDSPDRPSPGGERPHLLITLSPADLTGDGPIDLEAGPITAEAARRLACDANITPITIDEAGQPRTAGGARRTIPTPLRRALELRDAGCTHPGCDTPARWCDAHHIIHWAHGGRTTLQNLRLLCRRHHRAAHNHQPYPRRQ